MAALGDNRDDCLTRGLRPEDSLTWSRPLTKTTTTIKTTEDGVNERSSTLNHEWGGEPITKSEGSFTHKQQSRMPLTLAFE